MWTTRRFSSIAFLLFMATGCKNASDPEQSLAPYRARLTSINGGQLNGGGLNGGGLNGGGLNGGGLNGGGLNGGGLNGGGLNGGGLNGGGLNGGGLNGEVINNIYIDGSLLKGTLANGQAISGTQFVGATVNVPGAEPNPKPIVIRVDAAYPDNSNLFNDVWRYKMSYRPMNEQDWRPICPDASGQQTELIPIVGSWWDNVTGNRIDDPNVLTFACYDGAIEKCVHFGYRPWAQGRECKGRGSFRPEQACNQVSLKEHHQACTRMIRADYCGNGQVWTQHGTWIDLYDYLDPQIQHREEEWLFESRWVPTGATCLSHPRHPELGFPGTCTGDDGEARKLPRCLPYQVESGLVVNAYDPTGQGPLGN